MDPFAVLGLEETADDEAVRAFEQRRVTRWHSCEAWRDVARRGSARLRRLPTSSAILPARLYRDEYRHDARI